MVPKNMGIISKMVVFEIRLLPNSLMSRSLPEPIDDADDADDESSVGASRKISPNWSQETMTCHSSNCFSIGWDQGNAALVTSLPSSCYMTG